MLENVSVKEDLHERFCTMNPVDPHNKLDGYEISVELLNCDFFVPLFLYILCILHIFPRSFMHNFHLLIFIFPVSKKPFIWSRDHIIYMQVLFRPIVE